jgi:hypothetical protein
VALENPDAVAGPELRLNARDLTLGQFACQPNLTSRRTVPYESDKLVPIKASVPLPLALPYSLKKRLLDGPTNSILLSGKLRTVGPVRCGGSSGCDATNFGASVKRIFYMAQHPRVSLRRLFPLSFAALCFAASADAVPVVWIGPNTTFSKVGSDDPTLEANQDRLTANIWLTRGSEEGMFNIAPGHESNYIRFTSPADTQWATDVMAANVAKTSQQRIGRI